ncbi:MAG: sulfate ABC transporter permease subunit CysW [Tepidisphaerales bacterium]
MNGPAVVREANAVVSEPAWVRRVLIGLVFVVLGVLLVLPLLAVFAEALSRGWRVYVASVTDADALSAMRLTVMVAAVAVPLNVVFGVCAAWALAHFRFPGRGLLLGLIDLPLAMSPVVSGLMLVLLLGVNGYFGGVLSALGVEVVFAFPGLVLATMFVTFPYVARELVPLMESLGSEQEQAALVLGASGWAMFWRVTLPNIKWGLLYGVILCTARALGEFGAVSVVSGHIRGATTTLPLHVEVLYNEYNSAAAFACASVLAGLGVVTLVLKELVGRRRGGGGGAEVAGRGGAARGSEGGAG